MHGTSIVLLVPKAIARYDPAYDHRRYYNDFVLEYLQAENLEAGSSLVRTLRDGRRRVYKKDLKERFPCSKEFLYEFSRKHPEVLRNYREKLKEGETSDKAMSVQENDERIIAEALIAALGAIPTGTADATNYHRLMIGILEFIFFPNLLSPKKEQEIHHGRKRIDIVMENGAREGVFQRLRDERRFSCTYVAIECKNYTREIENPELDQLAGRFSPLRGKLGFICCRRFEDRALFIDRCRDTLTDDRGLIVPLDDERIVLLLSEVRQGNRQRLDQALSDWVYEIYF